MRSLQYYWYHPNPLVWLLLPVSWLFCVIAMLRRTFYRLNIKKSYAAMRPVIVVGNIVAGGSGKTPLLIALCEYIKSKGYKPGVVSRGYGGSFSDVHQVSENDPASLTGDEPLMIHQRAQVPVVVCADRVAAVNYLLEHNQCDIVLSDDGLQHYRMQRDIEIAVVDSRRGFGNGFCLPAGPLRERVSRLKQVDLVVYNGDISSAAEQPETEHTVSVQPVADLCFYELRVVKLLHITNSKTCSLELLKNKSIHAVAGIGDPSRFFDQLRSSGLNIIEHAFADHHHYQQQDFTAMQHEYIIMTEKDAVKCRHLALTNAWVVIVDAELSAALQSQLDSKVLPLLN